MTKQPYSKPGSLQTKIDLLLKTVASRNSMSITTNSQAETMEKDQNPATSSPSASETSAGANTPRRDQFLDKLPLAQQVEILRWAEAHGIRRDDPMWLLMDLVGYTKFMTKTLPSQMRAAGQLAVDAIAQQRRAEADAFSLNAQKAMAETLDIMTEKVVHASGKITDARLKTKILMHGLWVAGGIILLAATCFEFGFLFANAYVPWIGQPAENTFLYCAQILLGLPVGYLILPMVLASCLIFGIHEFKRW